jgi:tartrate dehydratase alpha subunit/fumarate hydratase class I-like protein
VESAKLDFGLHPAQLEVFQCPARFVAVAAGRRFGKSDLAAKRAIVKAFDSRNVQKKPVWLVGPVQPQIIADGQGQGLGPVQGGVQQCGRVQHGGRLA